MTTYDLHVVIEQDEDGIFIGEIPSLKSCYADGKNLEEMLENLKEVATLCARNQDVFTNTFVGVENIQISV